MLFLPDECRTQFAVCTEGETQVAPYVDVPELGRIVPYSPTNNLLTHGVVLFPRAVESYGSESGLIDEVRVFIHKYADLSSSFEEAATYYVLLTWVYDSFSEVPYLRIKGDFGSGKSRCLLTIGSICYKPMFVSGASTVSPMFRIIDSFRGTLILDESDFRFSDEKAEIVKILNNGNAVGFPVLRSEVTPTKEFNPRAFAVFGPKIIASRAFFDDPALESRCITETMTGLPPRADIPLSLPRSFHAEALQLRNKLLSYRFRSAASHRDLSSERIQGAEARVAQVFAPLLSVIHDRAAKDRIVAIARGQATSLKSDRDSSVEAQILDIMWHMRDDGVPWGVKTICEKFGERYGGDYDRPITPRWIGSQLRKHLSIPTVRSHGTFAVPASAEGRVRDLFMRFDIGDREVDVGT